MFLASGILVLTGVVQADSRRILIKSKLPAAGEIQAAADRADLAGLVQRLTGGSRLEALFTGPEIQAEASAAKQGPRQTLAQWRMLELPEGSDPAEACSAVKKLGGLCEPDGTLTTSAGRCGPDVAPQTNDTFASLQWGLQRIRGVEANMRVGSGATVVVAVIDTGVDREHPDLAGNFYVNPGEVPGNQIDDDGNVRLGFRHLAFHAYNPAFLGGVRVATADFNLDGIQDYLTSPGPGGGPHVRVISGRTGAPLSEFFAYGAAFRGGVYVAAGDIDGDGVPEVITGPGSGTEQVLAWDLRNLRAPQVLAGFTPYPGFGGGVRVTTSDLDRDGRMEIITAAGRGGGPHIRALYFDGAGFADRGSFFAFPASWNGGVFVGG